MIPYMRSTNLSGIDLNLLAVLEALLEEEHVGRAARRVGLSQPAASQALARLRALFKDELLIRSGARMVRTPYAQTLAAPLRDTLDRVRSLFDGGLFEPASSERTFTIMAPDVIVDTLAPPLLEYLGKTAPGMSLTFFPWRGAALVTPYDLDRLDFIITSEHARFSGFKSSPLYSDTDVLVVRANHPNRRALRTKAGFLDQAHIAVVGAGEIEDVSEPWLRSMGLDRRIAVRAPTYLLALRLAARSDLVAFAPGRLALSLKDAYGLCVLPAPVEVSPDAIQLLVSTRSASDAAHQWMSATISEVAERATQ